MNSIGTKTYLACSIAALLGSGPAFANGPGTAPQHYLYTGGGSAEPQAVQAAVCSLLTNVDSYTDATGGAASGDFLILYGNASKNIGSTITAGDSVIVYYGFKGGSYVNGAVPQAGSTGSNLTYPAFSQLSAGSAGLVGGVTAGTACSAGNGVPTYSYTAGTTTSNLPDFGITDLEATAFTGINIPTTQTPVTVGVPDKAYDLVEGVAVTDALFKVKSRWTSAEVAQILEGAITDWSLLSGDNGAPLAPAHNAVILLDRNVGSGTKAAGTSFFLNYPGLTSAGLSNEPNSATGLSGVSGANKTACKAAYACYVPYISTTSFSTFSTTYTGYQDIQDTSSSAVVADLGKANAAGEYAIAILSADNSPYLHQVSGVNTYDFVKINGEAMDLSITGDDINGTTKTAYDNVITGAYGFFYQVGFNTRTGFLGGSGDNVDLANAMKTALTADALAGAYSGVKFPLAAPGLVIDADIDTAKSTTGVTIATRAGTSSSPLKVTKFGVTITQANDPL